MAGLSDFSDNGASRFINLWFFLLLLYVGTGLRNEAQANAQDPVSDKNSLDVLKKLSDQARKKAVEESKAKLNDAPPSDYSGCKRIDLPTYKKANPYFNTKFELAINACLTTYASSAARFWESLDYAKSKNEPIVYEMALKIIKDKQYRRSDASSPYREWVDVTIDKFEGGSTKPETVMEAYLVCMKWAEIDVDMVLSGNQRSGEDIDRDIDRGSLACDG